MATTPTVQYDTKTGKKLSSGQSTMVNGVSQVAGSAYTGANAYGSNSNVVNYNTGTGQMLSSGGTTTQDGKTLTQGQTVNPVSIDTTTPSSPINPLTATTPDSTIAPPVGQVNAADTGANMPTGKTGQFNGQTYNLNAQGQPVGTVISQKYKEGLANAQGSGVVAPTTGNGASVVSPFVPPSPTEPGPSLVDQTLAQDPGYQQLLADQKAYNDVINQKTSLVDEYNQMIKDSGIQAINTELINTKNIIDGTEDDIRNEVTKAGGFATDSQVLAMSNARNKVLIKNYNNLLDTKQMAMEQVNTMIGLAEKDRTNALQAITTKMNIDGQIADYQQKMTANAVNGYQKIIDSVGYDGLAKMTNGDPYYTSLIEKTLGLGTGGLAKLAAQPNYDQLTKKLQYQKAVNDLSASSAPSIQKINGIDYQWDSKNNKWVSTNVGNTQNATPLQQAETEQSIADVNSLLTNPAIRTAVGPTILGRFVGRGLDTATGERQNFIASVEKLRSQLSLDSLINAKAKGATFGALSDTEMRILSASASKLGTWAQTRKDGSVKGYSASEKSFKAELEKINNFAKLDYILKGGEPTNVGVQQMPDGSYVTQNSDGTFTQLN